MERLAWEQASSPAFADWGQTQDMAFPQQALAEIEELPLQAALATAEQILAAWRPEETASAFAVLTTTVCSQVTEAERSSESERPASFGTADTFHFFPTLCREPVWSQCNTDS